MMPDGMVRRFSHIIHDVAFRTAAFARVTISHELYRPSSQLVCRQPVRCYPLSVALVMDVQFAAQQCLTLVHQQRRCVD